MYRYASASAQNAFRSNSPLSNDQIVRYAPSVMASEAHASRADSYGFIPTIKVLDGLRAEGFQPYEVRQTLVRDKSRKEHTKHMVRLRNMRDIAVQGGEVPEIILLNSHDGTSSYQLMAGYFRFVCSNGLIAGDVCGDIRIRHSGNVVDNVIEGATRILDNLAIADQRIDQYKSIQLTRDEETVFANSALQLRWEEGQAPVQPWQVTRPVRHEDLNNSLWNVFNRAQESLIKGGVRGRATTGRAMTTRGVGGVSENVRLNKALWSLADGMAQLKTKQIDVRELVSA